MALAPVVIFSAKTPRFYCNGRNNFNHSNFFVLFCFVFAFLVCIFVFERNTQKGKRKCTNEKNGYERYVANVD